MTAEQVKHVIETWDEELIKGYWELLDAASRENPDREKAAAYAVLALACQETLEARRTARQSPPLSS